MERPDRQAEQLQKAEDRRRIHLDQIGAFAEGAKFRLVAGEVNPVQIVIGDAAGEPRGDLLADMEHHLFRANEVERHAQRADALARPADTAEGRGGGVWQGRHGTS